jgi:catechol 2,3-dioxygenase-like lactoylglutathione lyase family enzyme
MRVTGLDHVSLASGDLDRSIDFYCGLLGLPLMNRGEIDDTTIAEVTGRTDTKVLFADIDLGDGHVLELLYRVGEDPTPGDGHVALAVDDVEEMHRHAIEAGVPPQGEITTINEPGHWSGDKVAYFTDPDGNTIEFIQPGSPRYETSHRPALR